MAYTWSIDKDNHKYQQVRDSEYCFFCQKKKDDPIHDTRGITLDKFKEETDSK